MKDIVSEKVIVLFAKKKYLFLTKINFFAKNVFQKQIISQKSKYFA